MAESSRLSSDLKSAAMGPIDRMPPETLSYIFIAFTSDNPPRPQEHNSPVVLVLVCRRWRDIALSTLQLWASFHLALAPSTIQCDKWAAHTWLSRSGVLPLTIKLGCDQGRWISEPTAESSEVLDILLSQSHRWRKLICRLDREASDA